MHAFGGRVEMAPRAAFAAVVGLLLLAPLFGLLAVDAPKWTGLALAAAAVELFLIVRPERGAELIVVGVMFQSLVVGTSFAKLGVGDLSIFAVAPAWFAWRLLRLGDIRLPPAWWAIPILLLLLYVSMMLGVSGKPTWGRYLRAVCYGATVFIVTDLVRTRRQLFRLYWLLALAGLVHAAVGFQGLGGSARMAGLPDQANTLAMLLAISMFAAIGLLLTPRGQASRLALLGISAVLVVALISTVSRGVYLAVIVAGVAWSWSRPKIAVTATLLATAVFFGGAAIIKERAELIAERMEFEDDSIEQRITVMGHSVRGAIAHPVFGVGFGQFSEIEEAIEVTSARGYGTHSLYLGMAATNGLPALFLFLFLGGAIWRQLRRARSALPKEEAALSALLSAQSALFVCVAVAHLTRGGDLQLIFMVLALSASVASVCNRVANDEREAREGALASR